MKFVVFGDLHYCTLAGHPRMEAECKTIATIHRNNTLQIRFPHSSAFGIGSISLDLLLLDGRKIRSLVSTELFVHGSAPDFRYANRYAAQVAPGGSSNLSITFLTKGE